MLQIDQLCSLKLSFLWASCLNLPSHEAATRAVSPFQRYSITVHRSCMPSCPHRLRLWPSHHSHRANILGAPRRPIGNTYQMSKDPKLSDKYQEEVCVCWSDNHAGWVAAKAMGWWSGCGRFSLFLHISEQHSVLPSCVDKLLDIAVLKGHQWRRRGQMCSKVCRYWIFTIEACWRHWFRLLPLQGVCWDQNSWDSDSDWHKGLEICWVQLMT